MSRWCEGNATTVMLADPGLRARSISSSARAFICSAVNRAADQSECEARQVVSRQRSIRVLSASPARRDHIEAGSTGLSILHETIIGNLLSKTCYRKSARSLKQGSACFPDRENGSQNRCTNAPTAVPASLSDSRRLSSKLSTQRSDHASVPGSNRPVEGIIGKTEGMNSSFGP